MLITPVASLPSPGSVAGSLLNSSGRLRLSARGGTAAADLTVLTTVEGGAWVRTPLTVAVQPGESRYWDLDNPDVGCRVHVLRDESSAPAEVRLWSLASGAAGSPDGVTLDAAGSGGSLQVKPGASVGAGVHVGGSYQAGSLSQASGFLFRGDSAAAAWPYGANTVTLRPLFWVPPDFATAPKLRAGRLWIKGTSTGVLSVRLLQFSGAQNLNRQVTIDVPAAAYLNTFTAFDFAAGVGDAFPWLLSPDDLLFADYSIGQAQGGGGGAVTPCHLAWNFWIA